MNIESNHMNAILRFKNVEDEHILSLHRIRPNITGTNASRLAEGIQEIRAQQVGGVTMTVTSELVSA